MLTDLVLSPPRATSSVQYLHFASFNSPCWLKLPQVSFRTDYEVEADTESFKSIEVGDDGGESHDGDDGKGKSHGNDAISPEKH